MPQPTVNDVHVAAALTDVAVAYWQDESVYIADKVFPMVPVQHQTDVYFVWSKADFFRDEAQLRADATESAGTGVNLTTQTYSAKVWALHQDIGAQVRANADPSIELDIVATRQLMQKMLIRRDRIFMSIFMKTGIWGTDITGSAAPAGATQTSLWSDDANGDPFTDIALGQTTVLQNTGLEPNILVLSFPVYQALRKHPLVLDRIKYTNPAFAGKITPQLLAESFDVDQILVSKAVYNTAAEGQAANMSFVMGKSALFCYKAGAPGIMTPTAGYTFGWANLAEGMNNLGVATYQIPMPWRGLKTVRTEVEMAFDMALVGSDLGYFFNTITA
jgi:Phage major capsid protein E